MDLQTGRPFRGRTLVEVKAGCLLNNQLNDSWTSTWFKYDENPALMRSAGWGVYPSMYHIATRTWSTVSVMFYGMTLTLL